MFGLPLLTLLAAYGGTALVFFGLDLLWLTVLGIGFYRAEIGPLLLERKRGARTRPHLVRSASMVLLGGFLLRVVVLLSSAEIHALGPGVTGP